MFLQAIYLAIGFAAGLYVKKSLARYYSYALVALTAYLAYSIFISRPDSNFTQFLLVASAGGLLSYISGVGYSLFVGPLMGKWPSYKNYYVRRGVVTGCNTTTEHGSTSTASQGVFGNVNVHTRNYSIDHDTFDVQANDGSTFRVSGMNIADQARKGDEIIVGGANGGGESHFMNVTQESRYTSKIASPNAALFLGFCMAIPFLGEFMISVILAGRVLLAKVMSFKGHLSEKPTPNEIDHLVVALAYHAVALCIGMMIAANDHGARMSAFWTYIGINMVCSLLHHKIWREDIVRFQEFLREKMLEHK